MTSLAGLTDFVKRKAMLIVPIAVLAIAAGAGVTLAQDSSSVPNPPKEKAVAAGEVEAKRLLLLMDKDQSGKVSRQEFMDFMAAEFDRLDKNKDGELDVKELTQTRLTAPPRGAIHR
jgi:hypothetical protein